MSTENLDNKFNQEVGSILKKHRIERGYSLEELAKKLNNTITRQALFKYENNEARIKIKTFKEICKALNLEPDDIIEEIAQNTYISIYKKFDDKNTYKKNFDNIDKTGISNKRLIFYYNFNLETIKSILKKENIITENENFTEEDYDRLIQFIKANKDFIIKKDK